MSWYRYLLLGLPLLLGCEEALPPRDLEMQQLFEEARSFDERGQYHQALVRYETILAKHPGAMAVRLNAAMSAYDSKQYVKSAGHFEVLHKFGPKDWFIIRKLVQCYSAMGDKEKVERYREKLNALRAANQGNEILKTYQGFTRDYLPVGKSNLIGYEFFDAAKHGRLWLFKLEDRNRQHQSSFLLEASPFHSGKQRLFYLTEHSKGWLRVWYVGSEGRDYDWTRNRVVEILQGKHQPLSVKPLPEDVVLLEEPGRDNPTPDTLQNFEQPVKPGKK